MLFVGTDLLSRLHNLEQASGQTSFQYTNQALRILPGFRHIVKVSLMEFIRATTLRRSALLFQFVRTGWRTKLRSIMT